MTLHIFIDESGTFDEGLPQSLSARPSIVGGVCGTSSAEGWESLFLRQLTAYNLMLSEKTQLGSPIQFEFPKHYHCSQLLAGKIPTPGVVRSGQLEDFAENIIDTLKDEVRFAFWSKNSDQRFEYSPQATYVLNLVAALRMAFSKLAESRSEKVDRVEIVVAQRTIKETVSSDADTYFLRQIAVQDYMGRLLGFVREQLVSGEGPGVELAARLVTAGTLSLKSDIGTQNAGLIAADFVCNRARAASLPNFTCHKTQPDAMLFGNYSKFYQRVVDRLIEARQYAAAADFLRRFYPASNGLPDSGQILKALSGEDDPDILTRELPALINQARFMIGRRTSEPGMLASARSLLDALIKIADGKLSAAADARIQRGWADLLVDALCELSTCHNHMGAVGPQQDVELKLGKVLEQNKKILSGTYHSRRDLLLEARTRNLNLLFNDYRFEEVLRVFEADVTERETQIPEGEPDELLGKMQGSLGQAWAFLASRDSGYSGFAREYFEKSLHHFQPGTLYYSMSVNYLATLAWQEGDPDLACRELCRGSRFNIPSSARELVRRFDEVIDQPDVDAFDAVNLLRIIALAVHCGEDSLDVGKLEGLTERLLPRFKDAHPDELLCKWLAFLHLSVGNSAVALNLCQRGVEICRQLDFTVQTIGLSILSLQARCAAMQGGNQPIDTIAELQRWTSELCERSAPFGDYISRGNDRECLAASFENCDLETVWKSAIFLPFAYS